MLLGLNVSRPRQKLFGHARSAFAPSLLFLVSCSTAPSITPSPAALHERRTEQLTKQLAVAPVDESVELEEDFEADLLEAEPTGPRPGYAGDTDRAPDGELARIDELAARQSAAEWTDSLRLLDGLASPVLPADAASPPTGHPARRMPATEPVTRVHQEPRPAEHAGGVLLQDLSEDELLAELQRRVLDGWHVSTNELSDEGVGRETLRDEFENLQQQAARRVLALAFLWEGGDPPPPAREELERALESIARSTGDGPEHPVSRLLTAAHLMQAERVDDVRELLLESSRELAGTGTTDIPLLTSENFQVVNATFARGIEGPGEYCSLPRREVKPGRPVLVYGEFKNFQTEDVEKKRGVPAAHRCSFRGSFELLNEKGDVLDHLEFLSEEHGRQIVASPQRDTVNFWARYTVPKKLPAGTYRLQITAEDMLASAATSTALEFAVD